MDREIKNNNKKIRKIIWISISLLICAIVLYKLISDDRSSRLIVAFDRIDFEIVRSGVFQDYIAVVGTTNPMRTVYLDAMEGGRVEEIHKEEGAMLKEEDTILRLSNTNLLLDIMFRESELAERENSLRTTRLQMEQNRLNLKSQLIDIEYQLQTAIRLFDKNVVLFTGNHISQEEYLKSKEMVDYLKEKHQLLLENQIQDSAFRAVQIKQLEESITRLHQNLKMIKKKLDDLNVLSPVEGQLASLNVEIGESVNTGYRLGQIHMLNAYKIQVEIDEHYISRVVTGLVGEFDFTGSIFSLRISRIYPEVRNGRFNIEMEFISEPPDQIRIGQTFRIRLELGESHNAILLPRGAFYHSTGGQWVYLLDSTETFAIKKQIRIGRQNPRYYEIIEGLSPGDKVIISGYDNFGNKDKLILKKS